MKLIRCKIGHYYDGSKFNHCPHCNEDECMKVFAESGAKINLVSDCGNTPLHKAVEENNIECVKDLIKGKIDVNLYNNNGETPLHIAIRNNIPECVKILIERGALANKIDREGESSLVKAITSGKTECLKVFLNNGVDINSTNIYGETLLFLAIRHRSDECIQILISGGAKINKANYAGETPFDIAVKQYKFEYLKMLYEAGAEIDKINLLGGTSLEIAILKCNPGDIKNLLEITEFTDILDEDNFSFSNKVKSLGNDKNYERVINLTHKIQHSLEYKDKIIYLKKINNIDRNNLLAMYLQEFYQYKISFCYLHFETFTAKDIIKSVKKLNDFYGIIMKIFVNYDAETKYYLRLAKDLHDEMLPIFVDSCGLYEYSDNNIYMGILMKYSHWIIMILCLNYLKF